MARRVFISYNYEDREIVHTVQNMLNSWNGQIVYANDVSADALVGD